MPFVNRTRATLRSAEFGFLGVWVNTPTQTPRFCGLFCNAGLFVLLTIFLRPARTSWLMVGIGLRKTNRPAPRTLRRCRYSLRDTPPRRFRPESPAGLAPENLGRP